LAEWVNEGKWPRAAQAVESTPEKQSSKALRLQEIGDTKQAADHYRRLADVYSESVLAEEGLIRAAKNYLAAGDFTKCREQLDELRRRYVRLTFLDAVGEVEIALARGFLEGKGEGGTYVFKSRIRKATAIFQRQYDHDTQGRWADDALFGLGQCLQAIHNYDDAIKKYKELLDKYPQSELRAETEGSIALCINKREPRPDYTESDTEEALKRLQNAKIEAAAGEMDLDEAALADHEKLLIDRQARKRFDQAHFYLNNNRFRAAEVYFELILERYPASEWAAKAKVDLEKMRQR
jgi:TolA-binding protein